MNKTLFLFEKKCFELTIYSDLVNQEVKEVKELVIDRLKLRPLDQERGFTSDGSDFPYRVSVRKLTCFTPTQEHTYRKFYELHPLQKRELLDTLSEDESEIAADLVTPQEVISWFKQDPSFTPYTFDSYKGLFRKIFGEKLEALRDEQARHPEIAAQFELKKNIKKMFRGEKASLSPVIEKIKKHGDRFFGLNLEEIVYHFSSVFQMRSQKQLERISSSFNGAFFFIEKNRFYHIISTHKPVGTGSDKDVYYGVEVEKNGTIFRVRKREYSFFNQKIEEQRRIELLHQEKDIETALEGVLNYLEFRVALDKNGDGFMISRFFNNQDLFSYSDPLNRIPKENALQIALTLTTSVEKLHEKKLVHRDIKTENILLHKKERTGLLKGCLGDSSFLEKLENLETTRYARLTPVYAAPELFLSYMSEKLTLKNNLGLGVDIFSLGLTFFVLFLGETTALSNYFSWIDFNYNSEGYSFEEEETLRRRWPFRINDLRSTLSKTDPIEILIHDMIDFNSGKRPLIQEVKNRLERIVSAA